MSCSNSGLRAAVTMREKDNMCRVKLSDLELAAAHFLLNDLEAKRKSNKGHDSKDI